MIVHVVIYCALAIAVVLRIVAKWSVIRMVQEINRFALPGGELLIRERVSLWWLPSYRSVTCRRCIGRFSRIVVCVWCIRDRF